MRLEILIQNLYKHFLEEDKFSFQTMYYMTAVRDGDNRHIWEIVFMIMYFFQKSMTVSYRDGESSCRRKFQSPLTTFTTVHNARKTVSY